MTYDVVVIGAGPAGYVCAIRAAQLGLKAAVVEQKLVGGVCLNVGCIPSKALIAAGSLMKKIKGAQVMGITAKGVDLDVKKLVEWKEGIVGKLTGGVAGLLKNHKIDLHMGTAKVLGRDKVEVAGADGKKQTLATKNVVVATGSAPIEIPGFAFDGKNVWSSTEALKPAAIPKRMLIIGGGYIGLELGLMYRNLGTEITVVEALDRVLPGMEQELSKEMGRSLKKKGVAVHLNGKAKGYKAGKDGLVVEAEVEGQAQGFPCDVILSTVGRRPNSKGLGLEELGVAIEKGFVKVDARRQSTVPGIWAIGDVAGQPMLAHKGSHEGLVAAAAIKGDKGAAFDAAAIPAVIFTDPEIASVGLSADEARAKGFEPVEGKFPFGASGRAMSLNETEGWVKIVADQKTDKVLGVHMIGPEVTELIAEATLAIEMGATTADLAETIHAHPTLPECVMEAAEAVHGMAVHIFGVRPKPTASGGGFGSDTKSAQQTV
jgi:dihydrolipoamide dehydrogenase